MTSVTAQAWRRSRYGAALVALLVIGACSEVKPVEYTEIHEIPPWPGLLSGVDGTFVLYRD